MSGFHSRSSALPFWLSLLLCVWDLFVVTTADYCDNPSFPRSCWFVHCTELCPSCVIGQDGAPVAYCAPYTENPPINYNSGGESVAAKLVQPGPLAGIILAGVAFWLCVALTPVCWRRLRQRCQPTVVRDRAARNARIQAQVRANLAAFRMQRAERLAGVRTQPAQSTAERLSKALSSPHVQMAAMSPRSPPQPSQQPVPPLLRLLDKQQPQPVYVYAVQPVSYAQPAPLQQPSPLPPSYAETAALDDAPPPPYVDPSPSLFDARKPSDNAPV